MTQVTQIVLIYWDERRRGTGNPRDRRTTIDEHSPLAYISTIHDVVAYRRANGTEPYTQFVREVERAGRVASADKIRATVRDLGVYGAQRLTSTERSAHVEDNIWELRPHPYRVMFFYDGARQCYVLLQGFRKQSQKTPPGEIAAAKRMRDDYYKQRQGERRA